MVKFLLRAAVIQAFMFVRSYARKRQLPDCATVERAQLYVLIYKACLIFFIGRANSSPDLRPNKDSSETQKRSSTVRRRNPTPVTRSTGRVHRLSDLNNNTDTDNNEYFGGDSTVFMSNPNDNDKWWLQSFSKSVL